MKKFALALMIGALALPATALAQQHSPQGPHQGPQSNGRPNGPGNGAPGHNGPGANTNRPPQHNAAPNRPNTPPARPGNQNSRPQAHPAPSHSQFKQFDHNRFEPGQKRYYADRYYRDSSHYTPFRVTRNTRIYRGRDGRYYCRRPDGTTGFIVGAAIGGILGNRLGDGDSALLSTILGASAGGLLGREIDRGNVKCH